MPREMRLIKWGNKQEPVINKEIDNTAAKKAAKEINEELKEFERCEKYFLLILSGLLIELCWVLAFL